ncbi:hypothetical protein ACFSQP_08900 [Bizionia sediminis]|uniref:Uncharacterized protein n=1 Tax=Bizionia sediminis TaxID=1737064 RepID=A0ABW5KSQ0_9FLAO
MKNIGFKNNIRTILSVSGLVLLLLLAPCKVRDFIQAELNLPKQEVLNKSQTTISQSSCATFKLLESTETPSKPTPKTPNLLVVLKPSAVFGHSYLPQHLSEDNLLKTPAPQPIPLYILYRNIKIFS